MPVVALGLVGAFVAIAAAQPVLVTREEQLVRRDAELYVVIDTSRSMLAAADAGEPNRFDRAKRIATELRREFPDLPMGLASMTDRLLPHLFPTVDGATYGATLARAMGVDRPPPRLWDPQRFTIEGHRNLRRLRCRGQTSNHTVGPGSQVRFELVSIHAPKDRVERSGTGGVVGEAEGLGESRIIIASPLGHGTIATIATQHRTTRQSEYGP